MEDVVVAVCTPECMATVLRHKFYGAGSRIRGKYRMAPDTRYIAFYEANKAKAVTYYAKVKDIKTDVPEKDTPGYYNSDPPWFYKAYYLEEPIKLERPIPCDGYRMQFGRRFTTLDKLKCAHNVADLFK